MHSIRDIEFKRIGDRRLLLDVHLPDSEPPFPAVIWIAGGGWMHMGKGGGERLAGWLTDHGIAVAPCEYRVSADGGHPVQIQDCLAAVRWVRAHAKDYGIDPDRLGVWGDSAGGHLAELVGVAPDVPEFDDGGQPGVSAAVQAVCAFYAPSDFTAWGVPLEDGAIVGLLGGAPADVPDVARAASPITHITPQAPPHLLIHGDADKIVHIDQSHRYRDALAAAGVEVELITISGAGHDSNLFYNDDDNRETIVAFFGKQFRNRE